MLGPARYLADFGRFAVRREGHECQDREALSELERRPLGLAPGLELEWLGVSAALPLLGGAADAS